MMMVVVTMTRGGTVVVVVVLVVVVVVVVKASLCLRTENLILWVSSCVSEVQRRERRGTKKGGG